MHTRTASRPQRTYRRGPQRPRVMLGLALACVALCCAGLQPPLPTDRPSDADAPSDTKLDSPAGVYYGSFSCAAAACHGSSQPDPRALREDFSGKAIRRDELVQWVSHDPHAKSARIMEGERWRSIVDALAGSADPASRAPWIERSCLPCHGMQYTPRRPLERASAGPLPVYRDGVGCESCHGPSSGWIGTHFREDFQRLSREEKRKLGLADTKSVWSRAKLCLQCHVAHPQAEVNHALIAAGHPRLQFDFATYFSRLPAHWNVAAEQSRHGGKSQYWQRLWVVGQFSEALAAARQVDRRAASDDTSGWPDYSDYDCYSCHHQLQAGASWRRERVWSGAGHRPVSARPSVTVPAARSPYFAAHQLATPVSVDLADALRQIPLALEASLLPARESVRQAAQDSVSRLAQFNKTLPTERLGEQLPAMLEAWDSLFAEDAAGPLIERWDAAVEAYWYLELLLKQRELAPEGIPREQLEKARKKLKQLRGQLWPPSSTAGVVVDTPVGFSGSLQDEGSPRREVRALLLECHKLLQSSR